MISWLLLIAGRRKYFRVIGNSMAPTLISGDLVIYRSFDQRKLFLEKGNIVVSRHPLEKQTLIIKRVHDLNASGLSLRGDNPDASTDSRQFGFVPYEYLVGLVEEVVSI